MLFTSQSMHKHSWGTGIPGYQYFQPANKNSVNSNDKTETAVAATYQTQMLRAPHSSLQLQRQQQPRPLGLKDAWQLLGS